MTVRPEFAEAERLRHEAERLREKSEGVLPEDLEDAPEREIDELRHQEQEMLHLDAEANEAHAPAGQVCERCGAPITADEDARLRRTAAGSMRPARRRSSGARHQAGLPPGGQRLDVLICRT
jgi:hypothetical protein